MIRLVKIATLATASAALFYGTLARADEQAAGDLVIRDVVVISPERSAPLEHAYVLIRDGRISQVSTQALTAERVIDGGGSFLIPGLIDSHVHLADVPGMTRAQERQHPGIAASAREQMPRSFLYFGFTTVVDLFGTPERIARWNGTGLGPDAYFCGGAPVANGYPMNFVPEGVRFRAMPYFLYDERQRERIPDSVDPKAHTPAAVVARMSADGAICVKTTWEPGFGGWRNLPTPTLEMVRSLVEAAHSRGMPVLLHANSKAAQELALAAGVDIIAHGLWNGLDGDGGALGKEVEELLQAIADRGVGYQPTMQVLHGELDLFDGSFLDNPMLRHAYPAALIDWYGTAEGGWFRDRIAGSLSGPERAAVYAPLLRRLDRIVGTLAGHGARLLFGSDTPSAPTYANPPGLNGLWEMRRWIGAGVDEAQLFRALTLENAGAFGLDDSIGTIEPGKIAHLLLLRENPLERVDAYDTIETVILAGQPIDRDRLSASRAAGAAPLVIGETFTLDSKVLEETRRINVFRPTYYGQPFDGPLPVLYMPDGGIDEDFLHVAGLVQILSANGGMRPFLLVGIENTERRRDLTGPTDDPEDRKIAPRVGGSAAFRAFIRDELMPEIRARYRVTDENAIVGESLAGLFIVETFLLEPELFDTYIAFDPSLWWNRQALVNNAAKHLRERSEATPTLYLATSAEQGIVEPVRKLAAALREHAGPGIHWHYESMPEETHASIYHPAALRAFRQVLAHERKTGSGH